MHISLKLFSGMFHNTELFFNQSLTIQVEYTYIKESFNLCSSNKNKYIKTKDLFFLGICGKLSELSHSLIIAVLQVKKERNLKYPK